MALVGFKVYVNGGGVATPATIFTALVLFELLRWALMNIPSIVIMLVDLKTAKARYGKYLHAPEVDTSMHLDPEGEAAVEVRGCDFSWGEQRALSAVSLDHSLLRVSPLANKWLLAGVALPSLLHLGLLEWSDVHEE